MFHYFTQNGTLNFQRTFANNSFRYYKTYIRREKTKKTILVTRENFESKCAYLIKTKRV